MSPEQLYLAGAIALALVFVVTLGVVTLIVRD